MSNLIKLLAVSALLTLAACGGNSSHKGGSAPLEPDPQPEPETSLDQAGVYRGSVTTDAGDLALFTLMLSRTGETAIALETDDSERPDIVLWGDSTAGDGAGVSFDGRDLRDASSVGVDFSFADNTASGSLSLAGISGDFSLQREATSDLSGALADVAGEFARTDAIGGTTRLSLAEDGAVEYSGECEASGQISSSDEAVNLYLLELNGDCIELEVLLSREDLLDSGDVLVLIGVSGEAAYAEQFYRL